MRRRRDPARRDNAGRPDFRRWFAVPATGRPPAHRRTRRHRDRAHIEAATGRHAGQGACAGVAMAAPVSIRGVYSSVIEISEVGGDQQELREPNPCGLRCWRRTLSRRSWLDEPSTQ